MTAHDPTLPTDQVQKAPSAADRFPPQTAAAQKATASAPGRLLTASAPDLTATLNELVAARVLQVRTLTTDLRTKDLELSRVKAERAGIAEALQKTERELRGARAALVAIHSTDGSD